MDFRGDQCDAIISKGLRLLAISEQAENIKKDSGNDEVRALAASIVELIKEIRPLIVFKP